MVKNLTSALYVLLFYFLLPSAPFGGRLLNLTVILLMLPAVYEYPTSFSVDHRLHRLTG
jgi:hypothetical protein